MSVERCACGCASRGRHDHHVVTQQKIREVVADKKERRARLTDRRNIVRMAFDCHLAHHNASARLPVAVLPDSVFEFAVELLGASAAFEYLRRYYRGEDPRLEALLERAA